MALYVGEERRRKYKVSLKCLSCQAFQEEIIKSQPDAFDAKIEGPFLLLSYSTTPLHAKTIASLERAAVSALLTILIRPVAAGLADLLVWVMNVVPVHTQTYHAEPIRQPDHESELTCSFWTESKIH
ncbi:unnamed protein product [Prunus armeniaca]|uniref:Uncharacterized protein n=1 Tax=Prunus armeniaca TaxID=36596 RepID=A0A6J5TKV1_PRUAR|nr:unnamed protein product [Prunus armeniaca]